MSFFSSLVGDVENLFRKKQQQPQQRPQPQQTTYGGAAAPNFTRGYQAPQQPVQHAQPLIQLPTWRQAGHFANENVIKPMVTPFVDLAKDDIIDPYRETAAILTHNQEALRHVEDEKDKLLAPKRFAGDMAQVGLTLAAPGISRLGAGTVGKVTTPFVGRVAGDAVTGAGFNAAAAYGEGADPKHIAEAAGTGAVLGAGLPVAAEGLKVAGKAYANAAEKALQHYDTLQPEPRAAMEQGSVSMGGKAPEPPADDPLAALKQEALKHKSADDFIKAQGTPLYHGTKQTFDAFENDKLGSNTHAKSAKEGFFFTDNKDNANAYTHTNFTNDKIVDKIFANKNLKYEGSMQVNQVGFPDMLSANDIPEGMSRAGLRKYIGESFDRKIASIRKSIDEHEHPADRAAYHAKLDKVAAERKYVIDAWDSEYENVIKAANPHIKEVFPSYKNPYQLIEDKGHTGGEYTKVKAADGKTFSSYTDAIRHAKENGYDAVTIANAKDPLPGNTTIVFKGDQVKTSDQLADLYHQAHAAKPQNLNTGDEIVNANPKTQIIKMSPDDYLKQAYEATDGRLGGSYESWLASNRHGSEVAQKYAEAMKNGDQFPTPFIDNARGMQDGRNRALAAKLNGQQEMEVAVVPKLTRAEELADLKQRLAKTTSNYMKHALQSRIDQLEPSKAPVTPLRQAIRDHVKRKASAKPADDPLVKRARNYKSAEHFEKRNNPFKSELWGEKPSSSFGRDTRAIRISMFPSDEVRGRGITKTYALNAFKDAYEKGHAQIVPSLGIYTKDGEGFMDNLVKQGWLEKQGGDYTIAPKIKEWQVSNPLRDVYHEAHSTASAAYPDRQWLSQSLRNNVVAPSKRPIKDAYIVGSEAKGTAKPGSDLDVAVVVDPVRGKTALQLTEQYHSKFRSNDLKPKWNGRTVDIQYFYPGDKELEGYSKIPLSATAADAPKSAPAEPDTQPKARASTTPQDAPKSKKPATTPAKAKQAGQSGSGKGNSVPSAKSNTKSPDGQERGFITSVKNSTEVSPKVKKNVEGTYKPRSTDKLADAADKFAAGNLAKATRTVHEKLSAKIGEISDDTIAKAIAVAKRHDANGAYDAAQNIYERLAEHGTKLGQHVQAFSLLSNRTPEGLKYHAIQTIKRAHGKDYEVPKDVQKELNRLAKNVAKYKRGSEKRNMALHELIQFTNKHIPDSAGSKLVNIWRAGLLTSPITTGGNIIGNTGEAVVRNTFTNPTAIAADVVQSIFTGKRTKAFAGGRLEGLKQGYAQGKTYMKTGYDSGNPSEKFEHNKEINYGDGKLGKALNGYVNGVYRWMGTQDKPFRGMAQNEAAHELARADAINLGLKGQERKDYIAKSLADPNWKPQSFTTEKTAEKAGAYGVFGNDTTLSHLAAGLKQGADKAHAGPIVDFVLPFTRVPSAIATRTIERTPIGIANEIVRQIIAVKKHGKAYDQRAMSEAIGNGMFGVFAIGAGVALAKSGRISGTYPADQKERQIWEAQGKQANSVKLGNRWYSLNYLQPFGVLMNIGADAHNQIAAGKNASTVTSSALATAGKSITQQSFLQGINGILDAVNNPQEYASKFVENTASSLVPNFIRAGASSTDSKQREVAGPVQGVQSAVPVWREHLPAKQDMFGQDLASKDNPLNMFLNPLRPSKDHSDKVNAELARLQKGGEGVIPTQYKTDAFKDTKLTPAQVRELQAMAGGDMKKAYDAAVNDPRYAKLSDEQKKHVFSTINSRVGENARAQFAQKYGIKSDDQPKDVGDPIAHAEQPKGSSNFIIAQGVDGDSKKVLEDYNKLDAAGRKKYSKSSNDADYKLKKAQYDNHMATNDWKDDAERIRAESDLKKAEVGKNYSSDVRSMYGLSKAQITNYLNSLDSEKAKQFYADLQNYDNDLVDKGVATSLKFKYGLGTKKGGGTGRTSSRSSGTKSSGGSRSRKGFTLPTAKFDAVKYYGATAKLMASTSKKASKKLTTIKH